GRERQFQVVVDPARLLKHRLSLLEVTEALQRNNANIGGGQITQAGSVTLVQGLGRVSSLEEIGNIVITAQNGVPISIRDIGQVIEGHEIPAGAVTFNGQGEAVMGLGFMLMGSDSRTVAAALRERMRDVAAGLPKDVTVTEVYDRNDLIDHV